MPTFEPCEKQALPIVMGESPMVTHRRNWKVAEMLMWKKWFCQFLESIEKEISQERHEIFLLRPKIVCCACSYLPSFEEQECFSQITRFQMDFWSWSQNCKRWFSKLYLLSHMKRFPVPHVVFLEMPRSNIVFSSESSSWKKQIVNVCRNALGSWRDRVPFQN